MLAAKGRVLEIGCGDAFSTRLVQQVVGSLVATDFDPIFVDDANERMEKNGNSKPGYTMQFQILLGMPNLTQPTVWM